MDDKERLKDIDDKIKELKKEKKIINRKNRDKFWEKYYDKNLVAYVPINNCRNCVNYIRYTEDDRKLSKKIYEFILFNGDTRKYIIKCLKTKKSYEKKGKYPKTSNLFEHCPYRKCNLEKYFGDVGND